MIAGVISFVGHEEKNLTQRTRREESTAATENCRLSFYQPRKFPRVVVESGEDRFQVVHAYVANKDSRGDGPRVRRERESTALGCAVEREQV